MEDEKDAEFLMNLFFKILNLINVTRCNTQSYQAKPDTDTMTVAMSKWQSMRVAYLGSDFPKEFFYYRQN